MQAEAQSKVTCVQIKTGILHDLQSCIKPPVKIPIIFFKSSITRFSTLSFASKGWHRHLEISHPDADIHLIQQMLMN